MKLIPFLALLGAAGLFFAFGGLRAESSGPLSNAQTSYYPNGQLQCEFEVENGRKEGLCRRYAPDGRLEAEGRYAAGKMDGEWSFWLADGTRDDAKSGVYRDGERLASSATELSPAGGH